MSLTLGKVQKVHTDVIVIGSGLAGCRAAIEAERVGVDVTLIDKSIIGYNSSSRMAGGHIKAAAATPRPFTSSTPASPEQHFKDKILIGEFLGDQELTEIMCYEGPARKQELKDFGVPRLIGVDEGPDKLFSFPLGMSYMSSLVDTIGKMGINVCKRMFPIDLLLDKGIVVGVYCLDLDNGDIVVYVAKAVVLACGGVAEAYKRNDTPVTLTGDGYAMGYRAGAEMVNMEMIHWEPFVHAEPDLPMMDRREAIAAWYGELRNKNGEEFLPNYFRRVGSSKDPFHLEYGAYNPDVRHLVSRAMGLEVYEGRGDKGAVFFDLSIVPEEKWTADGPSGYLKHVLCRGYDLSKEWIHVMPGVVATLGGLVINERCETTLPGLYAAGEVSGNVHGASRLGGDALSDANVFGARAGGSAARHALRTQKHEYDEAQVHRDGLQKILDRDPSTGIQPYKVRDQIKEIMYDSVGIIRTGKSIELAMSQLEQLESNEATRIYADDWPSLRMATEVDNMFLVCRMITKSALMRTESRGVSFRYDYPFRDDVNWLKTIHIRLDSSGEMAFSTEPVKNPRYDPTNMPYDTPISKAWQGVQEKMALKFKR